jgi:hypothetical protein
VRVAKSLDFVFLSRKKQWPADAHQLNAVIAQRFSLNESRIFETFNKSELGSSNATVNMTFRLEVDDENDMRWRYRLNVYFTAQFRTQIRNLSFLEVVETFVHYDARKVAFTLLGLFIYFNIAWRRVREGTRRSPRATAEKDHSGGAQRESVRLSFYLLAPRTEDLLFARAAALPARVAAERG